MLTITAAASVLGRHVKTLQRWDRDGTLVAKRSPTNRRYYTQEQLNEFVGLPSIAPSDRKVVAYCRVSSKAQKPDLSNQVRLVKDYAKNVLFEKIDVIEEVGGGLNMTRKKFLSLVDDIISGMVRILVVAHKDRLARFGFELIRHLCIKHKTSLIVIDNVMTSPEREMVEDLMAITHCFSARLYGLRNYKKALVEAVKRDKA